jgi:hypothetical protein
LSDYVQKFNDGTWHQPEPQIREEIEQ